MQPKTELIDRRIDPDETLEMCPACVRRVERFDKAQRKGFRVGEIEGGRCNRCGYRNGNTVT